MSALLWKIVILPPQTLHPQAVPAAVRLSGLHLADPVPAAVPAAERRYPVMQPAMQR